LCQSGGWVVPNAPKSDGLPGKKPLPARRAAAGLRGGIGGPLGGGGGPLPSWAPGPPPKPAGGWGEKKRFWGPPCPQPKKPPASALPSKTTSAWGQPSKFVGGRPAPTPRCPPGEGRPAYPRCLSGRAKNPVLLSNPSPGCHRTSSHRNPPARSSSTLPRPPTLEIPPPPSNPAAPTPLAPGAGAGWSRACGPKCSPARVWGGWRVGRILFFFPRPFSRARPRPELGALPTRPADRRGFCPLGNPLPPPHSPPDSSFSGPPPPKERGGQTRAGFPLSSRPPRPPYVPRFDPSPPPPGPPKWFFFLFPQHWGTPKFRNPSGAQKCSLLGREKKAQDLPELLVPEPGPGGGLGWPRSRPLKN